jgi:hypothetical protein
MVEKWIYLWLVTLSFAISSGLHAVGQVKLANIIYHQGMLGDQVIFLFDEMPSCIYEPEILGFTNKQAGQDSKRAEFFLPFTDTSSASKKDYIYLKSVQHKGFVLNVEKAHRPVNGLRLHIQFDPQKTVCRCESCPLLLSQKAVIFNFYHKKALLQVTSAHSVVRWCKNSVHQPRVIITTGDSPSAGYQLGVRQAQKEKKTYFAQQLRHALTSAGCEVMLANSNNTDTSDTNRVNYANMMVQANLLISLGDQNGADSDGIVTTCLLNRASF